MSHILLDIEVNSTTKNYELPFGTTFKEIKEIIQKDFEIEYPFNMLNSSERIYRNFGKMFLGQGVIQVSYYNRNLANFFNDGQKLKLTIEEAKEPITEETMSNLDKLIGKINNPKAKDNFTLNLDDFPPLA
jgi:hypothetical protein